MAEQPWKNEKMTKAEWVAREISLAVNAGKEWSLETVDFADPHRPLTCLEVDFPIIPINQIAAIEGNAGKPIYHMSKWWARRRSSIFRSMLIAAATKAPEDPAEAAKMVWNAYYGNHQARGAFKHLKVADIFMGGGTTVVEGSRLGMQMFGNDLNPVAWFIVKNAVAQVNNSEIKALLAEIESEVKPQIMPFYTCDCPRGHKGKWTRLSDGQVMGVDFDATVLAPKERNNYSYEGPEVIYVFWAKHGPCQVTGCGHRTPIMASPLMAAKTLSIKSWSRCCGHCGKGYDLEEHGVRMAPGVPLVIAESERPFAVAKFNQYGQIGSAVCPLCRKTDTIGKLPKAFGQGIIKKIELSLLVHPFWLRGESSKDSQGRPYGGSADDDIEATIRWNDVRASTCRLVEVRGKLPDEITCPDTGVTFRTDTGGGTSAGRGGFICHNATCGTKQDVQESTKAFGKPAPISAYAIHAYCPECDRLRIPYGGRFFAPFSDAHHLNAATREWSYRREGDLESMWPKTSIHPGAEIGPHDTEGHHFHKWYYLFNCRQLLVHSLILCSIMNSKTYLPETCMFVLGCFQQYLRNQMMFCFWNLQADKMEPFYSDGHFHPKSTTIENSVFPKLGRGNWASCSEILPVVSNWKHNPWELVCSEKAIALRPYLNGRLSGKSEKVYPGDPLICNSTLSCTSSTDLSHIMDKTIDLVVTDPPFVGLEQYAELSDFFYVWLRLYMVSKSLHFTQDSTPKALEAVSNKARHPENPDGFYKRILTDCWRETNRILKPGGLLAFTFHHNEDEAWVLVLESLFDAGFFLQATYPIRSDETKGENAFGSKKIEYDIIHVCRKRMNEPIPISWARLRRQILSDVRDIQKLLEYHSQEGLPEADLQIIRRGKALEYFSRHYGQVFKEPDSPMTVIEALLDVNKLLEEEHGGTAELPPPNAEHFTRILLRLFDKTNGLPRDQVQKFLRGTSCAPSDFLDCGWITEQNKVFTLVSALDIARTWIGKKRKTMTSDYEQAMFFIGACHEGSGINVGETLNNPHFTPHPALGALLEWFRTHGGDTRTRNAASIAAQLYQAWEARNTPKAVQLKLFNDLI